MRWAGRCALLACVYALGTVGCSSDSSPGAGSGGANGGDTSVDAGSNAVGDAGMPNGGTGNAPGTGDAGDGGSNGSDLAPGSWDASHWDQAVWQ